jgi:hypothetical protein
MNILFVNNQTEADTILTQQLIDDIVTYCNTPDNISFNFIDMGIARKLGYVGVYKVYNINWDGQVIYDVSYSCDDVGINNRTIAEIENQ